MSKTYNTTPTFLTVRDTAKHTGLPEYFIRQRLKNNQVPYLQDGNRKLINVELFLENLRTESMRPCNSNTEHP